VVASAIYAAREEGVIGGFALWARDEHAGNFPYWLAGHLGITPRPTSLMEWEERRIARWAETAELFQAPHDRLAILVDGIDEAPSLQRSMIIGALQTLGTVPGVRVVVAGRRSQRSLVSGAGDVLDLDDDEYFDTSDVISYIRSLLTRDSKDVAGTLGTKAGKNFLVAELLANAYDHKPDVLELTGHEQVKLLKAVNAFLASLDKDEDKVDEDEARALLTALAFGRGRGLSEELWILFAKALYPDVAVSIPRALGSRLGDYIDRATVDHKLVWRLHHKAIADALREQSPEAFTEADKQSRLVSALLEAASGHGDQLDTYTRRQLGWHAAAASDDSGWYLLGTSPDVLDRLDPSAVAAAGFQSIIRGVNLPDNVLGMVASQHLVEAPGDSSMTGLRQLGVARTRDKKSFEVAPDARGWTIRWADLRQHQIHLPLSTSRSVCALTIIGPSLTGETYLIAGCIDGTAWAWNLTSDDLSPAPLPPNRTVADRHPVRCLCGVITGDGPAVIIIDEATTCRLWNLGSGVVTPIEKWRAEAVRAVAACQVGDEWHVASASDPDLLRWWRITPLGAVEDSPIPWRAGEPVRALAAICHDGRRAIATGGNGAILLWNEEGVEEQIGEHDDWVTALAPYVVDETIEVASASRDGTVRTWPLQDDVRGTISPRLVADVGALSAASSGLAAWVVAGDESGWVRIWDHKKPDPIAAFPAAESAISAMTAWTAGGSLLVGTAADEPIIRIWANAERTLPREAEAQLGTTALATWPSPFGTQVLVGARNGRIEVRRSDSGAVIHVVKERGPGVSALAAVDRVHGNPRLGVGLASGLVEVLPSLDDTTPDEQKADPIHRHSDAVRCIVAFEHEGSTHVASGGEDGQILVSNVTQADKGSRTLPVGSGWRIRGLAAFTAPGGEPSLAVAGASRDIEIFTRTDTEWVRREPLVGHTNWTTAVASFRTSPNGGWLLATADDDGGLRVWERLEEPRQRCEADHESPVRALCPYPSADAARVLVSACRDGSVRFIDIELGHEIERISLGVAVTSLAVAPDTPLLILTVEGCLAVHPGPAIDAAMTLLAPRGPH